MARSCCYVIVTTLIAAALAACGTSTSLESDPSYSPPATLPASTSAVAAPTETASPTARPSPTSTHVPEPSSSPAPPSDAPPQRVTGVTAQMGGGSGEVALRWTQNPEPDVVSYVVVRATAPGGQSMRIGTVSREDVTEFEYVPFVDSEATVAYYRVIAVDSSGQEGPASTEICGASVGYSC